MSEQNNNPFESDQPKIVHLEKNESHYEYCRMQMHDINRVHKRTFFCNMGLCMVVCLLAMFHQMVAGFDCLSRGFMGTDNAIALLGQGIFQIIISMIVILMGYLAWANYHTLNLIMTIWYGFVTFIGIYRLDYLSAIIGAVGIVFYMFSIREMRREGVLSQMEGYPEFQEKFDISKSDIIVQTLMAHKGERRTKSTLFTTDYSLRRKKKKQAAEEAEAAAARADAVTDALAEELQKQITDAQNAQSDAPAPEAPASEPEPAAPAAEESVQEQAAADEMTDITEEAAPKPAEPKSAKPQNKPAGGKKHKRKK